MESMISLDKKYLPSTLSTTFAVFRNTQIYSMGAVSRFCDFKFLTFETFGFKDICETIPISSFDPNGSAVPCILAPSCCVGAVDLLPHPGHAVDIPS